MATPPMLLPTRLPTDSSSSHRLIKSLLSARLRLLPQPTRMHLPMAMALLTRVSLSTVTATRHLPPSLLLRRPITSVARSARHTIRPSTPPLRSLPSHRPVSGHAPRRRQRSGEAACRASTRRRKRKMIWTFLSLHHSPLRRAEPRRKSPRQRRRSGETSSSAIGKVSAPDRPICTHR